MVKIAAIASGSNGNCYYIEHNDCAILIDAGISTKKIIQRMSNLNLDIGKVKGVFITHEHSDHIKGVEVLSKNNNIPIYITKKTHEAKKISIKNELLNYFEINKPIKLNELIILPFPKNHDAADPCSFMVKAGNKNIGVMTDIGKPCLNVINHIHQCDALFLEMNYDKKMLENGHYPNFLKNRITGDKGHLSNTDAANLIFHNASEKLKYLFLVHLSENNNNPIIAYKHMESNLELRDGPKINLIMTSREKESELINLD